ncbi:MAG: hypothetical protein IJ168_08495 [Eubacterium sp.]|nr:hypothetical protein [Eubacterium sp.]
MTLDELAREYEAQFLLAQAKLDGLAPLLCIYSGKRLKELRRKMLIYYDMACECRYTASLLRQYYEDDGE